MMRQVSRTGRVSRRDFGTGPIRQFRPEWYADSKGASVGMYVGKWGLTLGWDRQVRYGFPPPMRLDYQRFADAAIGILDIGPLSVAVYHPARYKR